MGIIALAIKNKESDLDTVKVKEFINEIHSLRDDLVTKDCITLLQIFSELGVCIYDSIWDKNFDLSRTSFTWDMQSGESTYKDLSIKEFESKINHLIYLLDMHEIVTVHRSERDGTVFYYPNTDRLNISIKYLKL